MRGEDVNAFSRALVHHGIKGQKWGVKHGPPYPLPGGSYKKTDTDFAGSRRNRKKRKEDRIIKAGTELSTLSADKDRLKGVDMYYAAFTRADKNEYNALFNKKVDEILYDLDGKEIGQRKVHKYKITTIPQKDIKIASEDTQAKAFAKLYENDRDFYNFVMDPDRMEAKFITEKYRFKGYREAKETLDKIRDKDYEPTSQDLQVVNRMFNYVIPNLDNDTIKQRGKMFRDLKKDGYSGLLDTNDALYGGYHAEYPVIIIDQSVMLPPKAARTSAKSVAVSRAVFAFDKAIGLVG